MTNLEKYQGTIQHLSREAHRMAWYSGVWTCFVLMLIVLVLTILISIFSPFANMLIMLFIFVGEGILLFVPLGIHYSRAGQYVADRCLELEGTSPGICDAYDEWKQRELARISD